MKPTNEQVTGRKIILASTSPRRQRLLARTGLVFDVVASGYEEDMTAKRDPADLVREFARGKAAAVAATLDSGLVIGADTVVVLGSDILGKPGDPARATSCLRRLSGHTHSVITGFAVIDAATGKSVTETVETRVTFRPLTDDEISAYVATGEPMDKAGGYGIQGLAAAFVAAIDGDRDNVVGLPIAALLRRLRDFGVVCEDR